MNRKLKSALQVIGVSIAFFIVCTVLFGRGGAAVIIGSIVDLPTLFTIMIARYALTNRRAAIWTAINVLLFEVLRVNISPTYDGDLFWVHLITQGIIAVCVRTRFKKRRPVEETLQPFFTSRKKVVFGIMGTLLAGLLVAFAIDGGKRPPRQQQGFSDVDKRIMNGATLGTGEDLITGSAAKEHEAQNRAEEASFWGR